MKTKSEDRERNLIADGFERVMRSMTAQLERIEAENGALREQNRHLQALHSQPKNSNKQKRA